MYSKYGFCDYCEKKDRCPKDELDIIFKVMDNENDVTITDGRYVSGGNS